MLKEKSVSAILVTMQDATHSALIIFVNERRSIYFLYIQLLVFLVCSVLSGLSYFSTGEMVSLPLLQTLQLQTQRKCCISQQMLI